MQLNWVGLVARPAVSATTEAARPPQIRQVSEKEYILDNFFKVIHDSINEYS